MFFIPIILVTYFHFTYILNQHCKHSKQPFYTNIDEWLKHKLCIIYHRHYEVKHITTRTKCFKWNFKIDYINFLRVRFVFSASAIRLAPPAPIVFFRKLKQKERQLITLKHFLTHYSYLQMMAENKTKFTSETPVCGCTGAPLQEPEHLRPRWRCSASWWRHLVNIGTDTGTWL